MENKASGRQGGYDILRCVACLMVVILHTTAQGWYAWPVEGTDWMVLHVWNTASRGAVPVFFMLSGALFLSRPVQKKLWTYSIPRLVTVYGVWSLLYGIDNMTLSGFLRHPIGVIDQAMAGRYHLWFLPAMIGVYLILPALHAVAHHREGRTLWYMLAIFALFALVPGTVLAFEGYIPWALSVGVQKIVPELCGYAGYFLLGYALSQTAFPWIRRWIIGWTLGFSVVISSILGIYISQISGGAAALLHDPFTWPSCLMAVCLFLLCRDIRLPDGGWTARLFAELSGCTLGIYLLHPFVLDQLQKFGFSLSLFPGSWGVIPVAGVVCVICFCITAVLRRIPLVGTWLV